MSASSLSRFPITDRLERLLVWFVRDAENSAETRKRKVVVGFTLMILSWSPLYAWFYATSFPAPYSHIALGCLALGMSLVAAVPWLIRSGGKLGVSVGLLGFSLGGLLLLVCAMTGGYHSPLLPWMVIHPLLALGFGGVRLAWMWTACVFAELAMLASAEAIGLPTLDLLSPQATSTMWGVTLVAVTLTIFLVGWIYESLKNQSIRELEEANEAKSDFLAHMSHEIRTPMTAILGFAEELEHAGVLPEQREALRTIRRNGEHLLVVINDILDLSRVAAGHLDLELGRVWPDRIVREVAELMEPRARERGLELRVEIAPESAIALRSDATRLRQILINLAANAIKFTERGYVRIAALAPADGFVRFVVEDTGPGIPADKQQAIFEAFTQADASMSRRYGGAGLGLAISRRLATMLGGELAVESELGRGSRFSLRIPSNPHVEAPRTSYVDAAQRSVERLQGRILLAEDSPDSRRLLVQLLQRWGVEVEVAENGTVAVERVTKALERGETIDLVLMDMQMPEIDGYEATRRIRAAGYRGPVVALTAHAMAGAREHCLAAGCDDFLTKPIDRARFRAAVAAHLAAKTE
jgi:signal transduction histidine kinase/ActR/RegA family two-component response regulator